MATAAQKIKKKSLAECRVRIGRQIFTGSAVLADLVVKGFDLKKQMEQIKKQLAEVNDKVVREVSSEWLDGTGTVSLSAGDAMCTVSVRDSVEIGDAKLLQRILGDRFVDLVRTRVTFRPERKLIQMALNADEEMTPQIRKCLCVKEAKTSVVYKTNKY